MLDNRQSPLLVRSAVAISLALGLACLSAAQNEESRGVRLLSLPSGGKATATEPFDPGRSAALFVGVRTFTKDPELAEVPHAVDDAIDLAHLVALELEAPLVAPDRVLLALSGEPQKEISRRRLGELLAAGAVRSPATLTDLRLAIERQTAAVDSAGLLLVGAATHGVSADARHYLMAEDSVLRLTARTALPTDELFEAAGRSAAARRLLVLDACRERLTLESRGVGTDRRAAMTSALKAAIAALEGQVVLFAARPGGFAYNDPERGNGVFTAELLAGLRCGAGTDDRGFVTAYSLATYVNERVVQWARIHRPHDAGDNDGIEANLGGGGADLPLVRCLACSPAAQPDVVESAGQRIAVRDRLDRTLWTRQVDGSIAKAEITDLTGDGSAEVLVGVGGPGRDSGKLIALDCKGDLVWELDTTAPPVFPGGGHSGRLALTEFEVADLDGSGRRQVVTLSHDMSGWFPCRLCIIDLDGRLLASYWHPGHLHHLAIGSSGSGGPPRLILAGLNNDLQGYFSGADYVPVVLALDPTEVGGQAPPYHGSERPGPYDWYAVLQPTTLQVTGLEIVDRDRDGRKEISVWADHNLELLLDFDGNPVAMQSGHAAPGLLAGQRTGLVHLAAPPPRKP